MKKYCALALQKDIDKQYNDAAIFYQKSIDANELELEAYLNLSFLYWIFQDYGFSSYFNISDDLENIGYHKHAEIVELGIQHFPNNVELHFWKKYYSRILLQTEFSVEDCLKILDSYHDGERLVPYFFLNFFYKETYKEQIDSLRELCQLTPTAKFDYIKSVIE